MKFIDNGINWKVGTKKGKNFEILTMSSVGRAFWYLYKNTTHKFGPLYTKAYRQFDAHRDFPAEVIIDFCSLAKSAERQKPGSILKAFIEHEKNLKKLNAFDKKIIKINFRKYSNDQLAKVFRRSQFLHGATVWYAYNPYFLQYLGDDLYKLINSKTKNLKLQAEYFEILSSAKYFSLMQAEQLNLLHIVRESRKSKKFDLDKAVLNHLRKYEFFGYYYLRGKVWTKADLLKRIVSKKKEPLEKIEGDIKKILELKKWVKNWGKLANKLNLKDKDLVLINTIKQMAYVLNLYEEAVNFHGYAARILFGEVAKRTGINVSDLIEMDIEEIVDPLSRGLKISPDLRRLVKMRKKDSVFLIVEGNAQILEGKDLELYRQSQKSEKFVQRDVLNGQSASLGNATGKAALVYGIGDLNKVKKGNILVAMNTIPSFVPAMERAAAIVTETGGLLSHAAIVARELGLPCVVGVDGAMTAFKDGDKLEVDAKNGVVKKV